MNAPDRKKRNEQKSLPLRRTQEEIDTILRRFWRVLEQASQTLRQKKSKV
jgi:hypothetical protein